MARLDLDEVLEARERLVLGGAALSVLSGAGLLMAGCLGGAAATWPFEPDASGSELGHAKGQVLPEGHQNCWQLYQQCMQQPGSPSTSYCASVCDVLCGFNTWRALVLAGIAFFAAGCIIPTCHYLLCQPCGFGRGPRRCTSAATALADDLLEAPLVPSTTCAAVQQMPSNVYSWHHAGQHAKAGGPSVEAPQQVPASPFAGWPMTQPGWPREGPPTGQGNC